MNKENTTEAIIEKAIRYFEKNYNKPISVEQYAKEHRMSANWFIYNFREQMKRSPKQYLISLRIAAAKEYLARTDKSVGEIANLVGYENALYFSRLFKKYTGQPPSEYKR